MFQVFISTAGETCGNTPNGTGWKRSEGSNQARLPPENGSLVWEPGKTGVCKPDDVDKKGGELELSQRKPEAEN